MTDYRWLGVAAPKLPAVAPGLEEFTAAIGRKPGVSNWYESWSWKRSFPVEQVDALSAWGTIPQVTWEPWDPIAGHRQPKYRVADLGVREHFTYDYVKSWAEAIYAWKKPIRIRLAHEMNYGAYPWSVGRNGTTPSGHMDMWLRVRAIFADAKIAQDQMDIAAKITPAPDMVKWIWCVQTPFPGTAPIEPLFPGDNAVDEVALDGYNWAMTSAWNSFSGVFKRGIAEVSPMTAKPITIGETSCPEIGGDKAAWIKDMWTTLDTWPQIKGVLWFNFNKEADWRVDSSPASLAAFKAGLPGYTGI